MKAVAWEPLALEEFDDALAVSRDPVAFQRDVRDALTAIASGIIVHAKVARTLARRCDLTRLPYSIIYIESDDEARVWVFPHHKRKAGYWRHRLPRN